MDAYTKVIKSPDIGCSRFNLDLDNIEIRNAGGEGACLGVWVLAFTEASMEKFSNRALSNGDGNNELPAFGIGFDIPHADMGFGGRVSTSEYRYGNLNIVEPTGGVDEVNQYKGGGIYLIFQGYNHTCHSTSSLTMAPPFVCNDDGIASHGEDVQFVKPVYDNSSGYNMIVWAMGVGALCICMICVGGCVFCEQQIQKSINADVPTAVATPPHVMTMSANTGVQMGMVGVGAPAPVAYAHAHEAPVAVAAKPLAVKACIECKAMLDAAAGFCNHCGTNQAAAGY